MAKRDIAANIISKKYREDKPDSKFIEIVSTAGNNCEWTDMSIRDLIKLKPNKRDTFYVKDLIPISCEDFPHYSQGALFSNKKSTNTKFTDKTGLYKILFSDDSFIYFIKWFSGGGKGTMIESMFGAEIEVWNKWLKLFSRDKARRSKPKFGVYKIYMTNFGVAYDKIKKMPNNNIYHDELPAIQKSVNYYFNNVPSFMRYNQPGRRSLLLYGEQGTSKTSTLYKLAIEHKDTKCVVFSSDINALAAHIQMCEKYNIPTLAFLEDAEGAFSQNSSAIKNFLSGVDAKQNKGGTCIIYTTNYPEKIEETIIERPERIDELIYIGPISGQMLIDCAKFYFGEALPENIDLSKILTKEMTGAEVKLMVENTFRYCASHECEISEDAISNVLSKYKNDMKKLKEFSENAKRTLAKNAEKKNFGF